jgi:microcystin-dependent protein
MSNYTKATNFAAKDSLSTGNPAKVIKGTEIDAEYTAIASAISSKADSNSPTLTGTPLTPTASSGTSTTQIASTAFVATAVAAAFPSGGIIIWSGSVASVPSGWYLCNGSNGTPDLRDRFVVGAGSTYAVADTGGSANAIAVSHTHTATTASDGTHNHDVVGTKSDGYTIYGADKFYTVSSGGPSQYVDAIKSTGIASAGSHTHTITVASAGSSGTNANLPPYYALAYIMKA